MTFIHILISCNRQSHQSETQHRTGSQGPLLSNGTSDCCGTSRPFRSPQVVKQCHYLLDNSFSRSDIPLKTAQEVNYYLTPEEIQIITDWCKFFISKALTK